MSAVIFDFDGTIADSFSATVASYNQVAPWVGYKTVDEATIQKFRNKSMKDFLQAYNIHGWRALLTLVAVKVVLLRRMKRVQIHPGVAEMVRELRKGGVTVAVLTSNLKANTDLCLKRNGLFADFSFVASRVNLFAKDVALKWLVQRYGLDMSQTYYVGDETRDIEAAKRAGMKSIAVTWGFQTEQALERVKPDFVVNRPEEILNVVAT